MEKVNKARKNKKKNKEVEPFQLLPLKDLDEKDYLYEYLYFSWNQFVGFKKRNSNCNRLFSNESSHLYM